jgi:hypothetical protein
VWEVAVKRSLGRLVVPDEYRAIGAGGLRAAAFVRLGRTICHLGGQLWFSAKQSPINYGFSPWITL